MSIPRFKRLPLHVGIIPDGNRRWAVKNGMEKQEGYQYGIKPGFELYQMCLELGIQELTFYGFTQDNTKRPSAQTESFRQACVDAVMELSNRDADLLVIGNSDSPLFPEELLSYTKRVRFGKGLMRINFLVNYGWNWDINYFMKHPDFLKDKKLDCVTKYMASSDISRIDLVIRWGGRNRLSGFLPVQSVYADFYTVDAMWPDFKPEHLLEALEWYQGQDVTLGG